MTVPPGPLGVVLDGEIGDRPVVLEILGVCVALISSFVDMDDSLKGFALYSKALISSVRRYGNTSGLSDDRSGFTST